MGGESWAGELLLITNYMKHLNAFRERRKIEPLNTNEIALYFILMEYCNELGWIEWFTVANGVIQGLAGLSLSAFKRARTELATKGYIKYKLGNGNQAGKYLIVNFGPQSEPQTGLQTGPQSEPQLDHKVAPLTKPKTETKTKREKDILTDIQKEMLQWPEWKDFAEMRSANKSKLTDRAAKMALSKLEELAPGDVGRQKAILNQSTYHCWKGLFPLKEHNVNCNSSQDSDNIFFNMLREEGKI